MNNNNALKEQNYSSISEDTEFSFPVLRYGCVLNSQFNIEADISMRAASVIEDGLQEYLDAVTYVLEQELGATEIRIQGKAVRWRTRLGFMPETASDRQIADLPLFTFVSNGIECDFRACMTLCQGAKKSKLWFRLSVKSWNNKAATKLNFEQICNYFELSVSKRRAILSAICELYKKHLKQAGAQHTKHLVPFYASFIAFNVEQKDNGNILDGTLNKSIADTIMEKTRPFNNASMFKLSNSFNRTTTGEFQQTYSGKRAYLSHYDLHANVFQYSSIARPRNESVFVLVCLNDLSRIKKLLISQNDFIFNSIDLEENDMPNLYYATSSNESSRDLLKEFGSLF